MIAVRHLALSVFLSWQQVSSWWRISSYAGSRARSASKNTRSKLNSQSEIQLINPQGWTPNFSSECCPIVQKFKIRQKLKHVDLGYRSHGLENSSGGDSDHFSKTSGYEQILAGAEFGCTRLRSRTHLSKGSYRWNPGGNETKNKYNRRKTEIEKTKTTIKNDKEAG